MNAVLKIGHTEIMMDLKTATKVFECLQNAVLIDDRLYQGKIILTDQPLDLGIKNIPPGTSFMAGKTPYAKDEDLREVTGHKLTITGTRKTLLLR